MTKWLSGDGLDWPGGAGSGAWPLGVASAADCGLSVQGGGASPPFPKKCLALSARPHMAILFSVKMASGMSAKYAKHRAAFSSLSIWALFVRACPQYAVGPPDKGVGGRCRVFHIYVGHPLVKLAKLPYRIADFIREAFTRSAGIIAKILLSQT